MSDGHSPLEQFEVKTIFSLGEIAGVNIDFTNASLFMVLAALGAVFFLYFSMSGRALIPGRMQSLVEILYEFIATTLNDTVGSEGKKYFPFIFTLFMFILFANLLGMVPGSFTVTSHLIVTLALAMIVFLGVTAIGFIRHGAHFLKFFVPEGAPMAIAVLMIPIELFSYLTRPVSLSVRLAGNMMVGHTMMKIVAGFAAGLGVVLGLGPLVVLVLLTGFELFVAILQAYIFTILSCVYLNDAIHMH